MSVIFMYDFKLYIALKQKNSLIQNAYELI